MNPQIASAVNLWGPALMVCFSLLIGVIYQNSRLNDLNTRITEMKKDILDLMNARFDAMAAEIKRLDQRIDAATSLVRK